MDAIYSGRVETAKPASKSLGVRAVEYVGRLLDNAFRIPEAVELDNRIKASGLTAKNAEDYREMQERARTQRIGLY